ncbi:S1C family serine protease [Actinospica acidithermotolerans]|uniref:S1C family serine protease n=1 Tax=Actinospica acidithermotolerans TaxID=2828514 RepID=UPI001BA60EF0|nr:trypsin-like peptidase domain-containing protein [Actinospica acidithermotolerans]
MLGVVAVLGIGALALGGCTSSGSGSASSTSSPGGASLQTNYEDVIASVMPSVVEITSPSSLGTGEILDTQGDIVTNNHVVAGSDTYTVTLSTSGEGFAATLVSRFPQGDLAVIKLTNPPSGLKPVTWADSSKAAVGQIVLAMGNPIGLSSSSTDGIISATGRTVTEPKSENTPAATLTDMIQTSAEINSGNSGGALVDLNGHVVGIPTLTAVDQNLGGAHPGIGFAIPSNEAKRIADQIVTHGKVVDSGLASLGITGRTVIDSNANPVGVGVVEVTSGGPAANAGIVPGDLITSVDKVQITSMEALSALLATLSPGQKVPVGFTEANGTKSTVEVTLGTLQVS